MNIKQSELLQSFEACTIDASLFDHTAHIRVAYEMLNQYDFLKASYKYAEGIYNLAKRVGAPTKFNATITLSFLSLIAERMEVTPHINFEDFLEQHPDLTSKHILNKWYSSERLQSDLARSVFLMPDAQVESQI